MSKFNDRSFAMAPIRWRAAPRELRPVISTRNNSLFSRRTCPAYVAEPPGVAPKTESPPSAGSAFRTATFQLAMVSASPYSAAANACSAGREFSPARCSRTADMNTPATSAPNSNMPRMVTTSAIPRSFRTRAGPHEYLILEPPIVAQRHPADDRNPDVPDAAGQKTRRLRGSPADHHRHARNVGHVDRRRAIGVEVRQRQTIRRQWSHHRLDLRPRAHAVQSLAPQPMGGLAVLVQRDPFPLKPADRRARRHADQGGVIPP